MYYKSKSNQLRYLNISCSKINIVNHILIIEIINSNPNLNNFQLISTLNDFTEVKYLKRFAECVNNNHKLKVIIYIIKIFIISF